MAVAVNRLPLSASLAKQQVQAAGLLLSVAAKYNWLLYIGIKRF